MPDAGSDHHEVVARHEVRRDACEAHLRQFLGDDMTFVTEKVAVGFHLDLFVFAPTDKTPFVTIVTSGMSDVPMTMPEGFESGSRLELLIAVPPGWPGLDPLDADALADEANYWPVRLLKEVARIPYLYDTFLSWGHTIDHASELLPADSPFGGAIIGPPYGIPAKIMRASTPVGDVDYLAVFPLTRAEMDYRVATPGGGDAIIERFADARVSAIVNPQRPSVVDGPPPWSVHLLMTRRPETVGEVLTEFLPETAAALSKNGDTEFLLPAAGEKLNIRVAVSLAAQALVDDLRHSPERDKTLPAVAGHRGTTTLTPVNSNPGDQVMAVMAIAAELASRDDVVAVWLPHQNHVSTPEQFIADARGAALITMRPHPHPPIDGQPAVITRGFTVLGGWEVVFSAPDATPEQLTKTLQDALGDMPGPAGSIPESGQRLRAGGKKYDVVDYVDPQTGDQLLRLVERESRGLFGKRK